MYIHMYTFIYDGVSFISAILFYQNAVLYNLVSVYRCNITSFIRTIIKHVKYK